ncbi:MAG: hypothetical protein RSD51_03175 [Malacoplasma sp.]
MLEYEDNQQILIISLLLNDIGYLEKSSSIMLTNVHDFFYKTLDAKYVIGNDDLNYLDDIKSISYINSQDNEDKNHIPLLYAIYPKDKNVSESVWELSGCLQNVFNIDNLIVVFSVMGKIIISFTKSINDNSSRVYLSDFIDLFDQDSYELTMNKIICANAFSSVDDFVYSFGRDYYDVGTRLDMYNIVTNTEIIKLKDFPFSTRKEIINERVDIYWESLTSKYGDEFFSDIDFHRDGNYIKRSPLKFNQSEYNTDKEQYIENDESEIYEVDFSDFDYLDDDIFASADSLLNWLENGTKLNKKESFINSLTDIQNHYLFSIYNNESISALLKLDEKYNCGYRNVVDQINKVSNIFYKLNIIEYDKNIPIIISDYTDIIGEQFDEIK